MNFVWVWGGVVLCVPCRDEGQRNANFLPEYGRHMVEATPRRPYGSYSTDLVQVERNMNIRRELIEQVLAEEERYLTLAIFPLLGVGQFTHRPFSVFGPATLSEYVPDEVINQHPRFPTLSQNIRMRYVGARRGVVNGPRHRFSLSSCVW